ncbi:MAG: DUF4388 domain-containing protein [Thermoanaerobaculia bacterium]|nr:DUF4388 domain-containing protein [Thermoanaerobaculia bacterium]
MQGSLKSFRLFDLLTFFALCHKTGTLQLAGSDSTSVAYFRNGELIFASTDQPRFRIGSILRERDLIDDEQEARVAGRQRSTEERFGASAVRLGIIDEEQLRSALKIQVSEIIYDALTWSGGDFRFYDEMELPEQAVTISVDITNLIMEGARRIDEWDQCLRLLPDDSVVFRIADNPELQEKISLSLDEWRVLFRFDGHKPLRQVLEESGEDPLDFYRVVYGLLASNLVEEAPEDTSTRTTLRQQMSEPIPSPAGHTGKIMSPVFEISDEEWKAIEDDTKLLVSDDATLRFSQVRKMATSASRLRAVLPDGDVQLFPLDGSSYVIGRAADAAIRFTDTGVSARHAKLTRNEEGYVIEDMHSRNGTIVNDAPIERTLLRDGDKIRVGRIALEYQVRYSVD